MFRQSFLDMVAPGAPFTKSISVLPAQLAGFPLQSCVFAVVLSDNAPDPALSAIVSDIASTFFSLANRVAGDNDVAQRSINIQEIAVASTETAVASTETVGTASMLAWVEISNPLETPAPASLEVDTSQAANLKALTLEMDDNDCGSLEIGKTVKVNLEDDLQPGDHRILRFRAILPPGLPNGATFPIHLKFFAGDQFIGGYTHMLRVAPLPDVIFQVLDVMYGALRDVAVGCKVDEAQALAESVRKTALRERQRTASSGCFGLLWSIVRPKGAWRSDLTKLSANIMTLAQNLESRGEPEVQVIGKKLSNLGGLLSKPEGMDDSTFIEQIRDRADRVQQPAGRLVHQQIRE
jgi:hypothetical protein